LPLTAPFVLRRRVFLRRLEAFAQDFCLGGCFETGLPPLLSTNGSVSIRFLSISYPELALI
jgi:hypothetical protein